MLAPPPQEAAAGQRIMRLNFGFGLSVALLCTGSFALAQENNLWPLLTRWTDAATGVEQSTFLGPFGFESESPARADRGFRPRVIVSEVPGRTSGHLLYPLLNWESADGESRRNILQLIRWSRLKSGTAQPLRSLEVWPFYLSRQTGDPATSYRALFPIAGTIKNRFGNDRIEWVGFPLYGRFEKDGVVTTTAPWPFIKHVAGAGTRGFEFWPLFGSRGREGVFKETFALWPIYHHNERTLPDGFKTTELAVLPFYERTVGRTAVSETFLWPFFGYTHSDEPRYREKRWLWPFFVTARGEDRHVNRFAPFYTFSNRKGVRKTWVLWPLVRHQEWNEAGLDMEKDQFLYFLYWNLEQRSPTNPELEPAHKTHLWPLFSRWNNGAGHRQFQLLSPLEVFFQHNETVRKVWSPLFSLYRAEQRPSGDVHRSFLFNFITTHREGASRQFNFGPLLETRSTAGRLDRVTFLKLLPLYSRKDTGASDSP